jgi:hypothetical protein
VPALAFWLVLVGTACIIGGEALCLLGPMRYERIVHVICHVILYAGVASVVLGAMAHWTRRVDSRERIRR